MNLLKKLALSYNYELQKNYLYFIIADYLITVRNYVDYFNPRNNGRIIFIPLDNLTSEEKTQVMDFLQANSLKLKIRNYGFDGDVLVIRLLEVYHSFTIEEFNNLINTVIGFLKENNIKCEKTCIYCQENNSDNTILINKIKYYCHTSCKDKLDSLIKERQEVFAKLPKNYKKGLMGAFLGALLFSIPWIILAVFWGYAAIFGMLICYGAYQGYKRFGGVMTKRAQLLLLIPLLFTIVIAHIIVVIITLYQADIPINVYNLLVVYSLPETGEIVLQDLGLGILFGGLGYFSLFGKMKADLDKQING